MAPPFDLPGDDTVAGIQINTPASGRGTSVYSEVQASRIDHSLPLPSVLKSPFKIADGPPSSAAGNSGQSIPISLKLDSWQFDDDEYEKRFDFFLVFGYWVNLILMLLLLQRRLRSCSQIYMDNHRLYWFLTNLMQFHWNKSLELVLCCLVGKHLEDTMLFVEFLVRQ